jgi:hypothetical protein
MLVYQRVHVVFEAGTLKMYACMFKGFVIPLYPYHKNDSWGTFCRQFTFEEKGSGGLAPKNCTLHLGMVPPETAALKGG